MKNIIRKAMIERRQALSVDDKKKADQDIIAKIRNDTRYQKAKTVALFYPMSSEIDLLELLKDHKTFLFPKVIGKDIMFYPYHQDTHFKKSEFGVSEPVAGHPYQKQIDYMIIPALAIDKRGYRLGYGKGFYDRYLMTNRPKTAIGVIYSFQLIEQIETNAFDQILDGYVKG